MMMTIGVNNINGDCNHHKMFKMFHTNLAQEKNFCFLSRSRKRNERKRHIYICDQKLKWEGGVTSGRIALNRRSITYYPFKRIFCLAIYQKKGENRIMNKKSLIEIGYKVALEMLTG